MNTLEMLNFLYVHTTPQNRYTAYQISRQANVSRYRVNKALVTLLKHGLANYDWTYHRPGVNKRNWGLTVSGEMIARRLPDNGSIPEMDGVS